MNYRLSDSELAIMQILWRRGEMRAAEVADIARGEIGWERNTSYTFLNRLIKKGAVSRRDPGFVCTAKCSREELCKEEAHGIVNKLFGDSLSLFVSSFLNGTSITPQEKENLQKLIDSHKPNDKGGA